MTPSLFARLLSVARQLPVLLAASKAQQPVRTAAEFPAARLRVPAYHQAVSMVDDGWSLQDIRDARREQVRGRFRRPVQLAVAMRTNADCFAAWRVRTAPLSALAVRLDPAGRGARAKSVARQAEPLFGEPGPNRGVGFTRDTEKTLVGDLANHAVAVGYNRWTARDDGSWHDVEHLPWPLEGVEYDELDDQLYTTIDTLTSHEDRVALAGELSDRAKRRGGSVNFSRIPICHGDGRWVVYQLSGGQPWRQDAAILPGGMVWASDAYAYRDWNMGSTSHGNTKMVGTLKEGVPLQVQELDSAGSPILGPDGLPQMRNSDEAEALMDLLEDLTSLTEPYGVTSYGTAIDIKANPSNMWQVWKELGLQAQRLAYLIYTGTTAALGVQSEGPGVNVEQLMDVGLPIVQSDKAAMEKGFHEGVMVPWVARNHGDSSLAPTRSYLLPDVDRHQHRKNEAENEDAFMRAFNARKSAGILTAAWAKEYSDRLGVHLDRETLEELQELEAAAPASGVRPAA